MFNVIKKSCPYQNWTSVAKEQCPNPVNFHCLKDEFGRIVWLCSEPIWVKKDRCPVFNVVARTMDTTSCLQTRCPPYDYRSNDIDVEYACRFLMEKESSTTPFTTKDTETSKNSTGIIVTSTVLTLVTIIMVVLAGIMFYKRRRQPSKNNGKQEEESLDLMQETTRETARIEEKPACLFDQAKMFLIQKKMVVITGVPGSGKTFLAKSLVNELQKNGYKMKKVLICNLDQLQQGHSGNEEQLQQGHSGNEDQLQRGPGDKVNIYIIDDIFHELQNHDEIKETLTAFNEFLSHAEETYFIITIPSCTWTNNGEVFDPMFYKVEVNLDKRDKNEKLAILQSLQTKYDLSNDQLAYLDGLKNEILLSSFTYIGFPALVLWMFKQTNVEQLEKSLCDPLNTIRDEISSIKNGTIEDKGKFLVLSYMCLNDGKIDVRNVDENLFNFLKNKYAPKFDDKNLAEYCNGMVDHCLLSDGNSCYEFNLNIIKKTACDIVEKDNCKKEYLSHINSVSII
nr:uncharacterized protein LOC117682956 isoform X2 [Crassostrea gigas]